jgi:hypothetical protein
MKGGSTMRKKVFPILSILFSFVLTTAVFAQSSTPSEEGTRPGPGYGMGPGGGHGYGPGYGYGMGPWMMMGPGWHGGYGMGPGMMGPGYGYGPGEGPNLTREEREARAKAFVDEYIRRYLPGYSLEKKPSTKTK